MSFDLIIILSFLRLFSVVLIVCFFICRFAFVDYLMKRFDSARHLAAKNGTNSGVLIR